MSRERILFEYIRALLSRLDAEHSHQEPCETCTWLEEQPEWQSMKAQKENTP